MTLTMMNRNHSVQLSNPRVLPASTGSAPQRLESLDAYRGLIMATSCAGPFSDRSRVIRP